MGENMKDIKSNLSVYAVTDRAWCKEHTLEWQIEQALKGGATLVQLREKNMSAREFIDEAKRILLICRKYNVPLLINDNVEVALAAGADGVHLGQSDMEPAMARTRLGDDKIIGVTAKTVEQAVIAMEAGADYIGSGAVFGSTTKKDTSKMEHSLFKEICDSVDIPVVAIGGITLSNMEKLRGCNMSGFAFVSGIFAADDIRKTTAMIKEKALDLLNRE